MFALQRLKVLGVVLFLGCAPVASAADDQLAQLSESVSSLERVALPPLIASQDFWSASKVYFQLAVVHNRLGQTLAACADLSQSLTYYRAALVKDNLSLAYFGDMATDGTDNSDSMKEMNGKFGCDGIRSALLSISKAE
jgi:hypothetical protein